ncbi:MAG: proline dehydrogenase family protein [Bacteroidota bacterium]
MDSRVKFDFANTAVAFSSKSDKDLRRMNLLFSGMNLPWLVKAGTYLLIIGLKLKLPLKKIIRNTVFDHFCGGESIADCEQAIDGLKKDKISTILDYSAEGEKSPEGFDQNKEEMLRVVDAAHESGLPFCVVKLTGFALIDMMERIQAGTPQADDEVRFKRLKGRLEAIAERVAEKGLRLLIDAEETWVQEVIDNMTYDLIKKYNKEKPVIYNTYQMYRTASLANLKKAHKDLSSQGLYLGAKIVRGAYMEKERERAEELGYPDPIQPNKESTDRDYNSAIAYCVENLNGISIVAGTHNEESSAHLAELMENEGISPADDRVYFSQLYGMSDHISYTMAKHGFNVVKYLPYGPVEKVMPYLIRRAEENTSIAGQSSRELQMIRKEINRRKTA